VTWLVSNLKVKACNNFFRTLFRSSTNTVV